MIGSKRGKGGIPVVEGSSACDDDELLSGRGAEDAELTRGADTDGRLAIDEAELAEDGRAVSDEAMMDTTVLDSAAAGGTEIEEEVDSSVDEVDDGVGAADDTASVEEVIGAADGTDSVDDVTEAAVMVKDSTDEESSDEDSADVTAGRAEDTELVGVGDSFVLECASAGTDIIVNPMPPLGPVPVASGAGVPAAALLVASLATAPVPASVDRLVAASLVAAPVAAPDATVVAASVAATSVLAVTEIAELSVAPWELHGAVTETVSVMVDTTELTAELSAAA